MVGLANDFEVPQIGSPEFNELADRFGRQVENALQAGKVPGFKEAAVTEFLEYIIRQPIHQNAIQNCNSIFIVFLFFFQLGISSGKMAVW